MRVILISLIITSVIVVGGSMYYFVNHKRANDVNSLNSQVGSLQSEINSLKSKISSLSNATSSTNLTNDQIFQEAANQLGLTRSSLAYFRIFGQDKIQYSISGGNTYAYKTGDKWIIAAQEPQSLVACSTITNIPTQYMPPCSSGTQFYYVDPSGSSVNYPVSLMVSYIGQ